MRRATTAAVGSVLATLLLLLGYRADAAPDSPSSLSKDWKRVRSANFVVVGNGSEDQLRSAVVELERFRQALLTLWPTLQVDATVPTILVLFKDDSSLNRFKPRNERGKVQRQVAGYFAKFGDVNYMVAGAWGDRSLTFDVIFHEYTHYILHRSSRRLPPWADEGLAEFYSTFFIDKDGRGVLGQFPPWRLGTLRGGGPHLRLDRFLTTEGLAKPLRNDAERQRFYAQAWALVHYSILGARQGQLGAYLRALERGASMEDAYRDAYKVSLETLQQELYSYVRKHQLPAVRLDLPEGPATAAMTVERMQEADALQLQGDLLMRTRADDEAERTLNKALALDRGHAAARVSLAGVLRHRERFDEAIAMLQTVTAEAPRDFASHYWLAVNLAHSRRYEDALRAWSKAVEINERSSDAWVELSIVALALGRISQGQAAFTNARRLDSDVALYHRRAQSLFAIGYDAGVAADVAAYVRETGWGNDLGAYMAFLGALAHWRLNDAAAADALLAGAAESTEAESWTGAVSSFLRGSLAADALLKRAQHNGELTEAHAYIGLKASTTGRPDEALPHLTWVKEHGSRNYTEYGLATAELRRLQSPPPQPPAIAPTMK